MVLSSIFLTLPCFSCQVQLLVQALCQYHDWFWSYCSFFYKGVTRNLGIGNTPVWALPNKYSFSLKSNLHAYTQNSQNSSLNFYRFHCCLSFYHLFKVVKASNHAWVLSLTLRLHHDLLLSICSWVIGVGPTLETYRYVVLKRFPGKIHHDPLQYVKTLNIKNKKFQVTQ